MKTKKQKGESVEKSVAKARAKLEISKSSAAKSEKPPAHWTFFSNHSHVLICIAREPDLRLRDVAERVGITERGVQRIIADLEEAGILSRARDGRRNHYKVHAQKPLRHAVEAHCTVGDLLKIVEAD
jgi:DNA-binding MarR family transcriptional regulator